MVSMKERIHKSKDPLGVGYQELPTSIRSTRLYENGILPERMEIANYADQRFKKGCRGFDPAELQAQAPRLRATIEFDN